ncbi:hypothetical protein [uncultured Azohydromonas sp.]|uniref:hypothetical protein n=1 Tax=uncultured Azohydromonas sp. TaxID=487342 RepID=UPI00263118CE|nr:hypothetical protein [uncultured Azohydromonas sp.]
MRRSIAIVLMLLLPIQSAWALVAMPCRGHVSLQGDRAAVMAMAVAHEAHAGHHAALADHGHHAGHGDAHAPAHEHHAHHDAAPPAGHDPGDGGIASEGQDPCSGSAACMSLHSPPLAAGFDAGLPALKLSSQLRPAGGERFSSVPPQRLQRPPIGLAA